MSKKQVPSDAAAAWFCHIQSGGCSACAALRNELEENGGTYATAASALKEKIEVGTERHFY
jgi:hypothetical protein